MLKDTLRWVVRAGIFAIPVIIPFIVSASMFFPYITGKNFTFRIIVEIIFAAWIILAFLDAKYRPRFSWVLACVTAFTVIVGLADLFGANPFKSFWSNFERMEGYIAILHLFAYFLVASTMLTTEKLWRSFWYTTLGASIVVALTGLAPLLDLKSLGYIPRLEARFGNPIYLAVYSLFHIFIALILMARWRGARWHQVLMGFIAVVHIVTMVLTMTRGTVIGFLGGIIITALLIAIFERERKVLRWVSIGALLLVVAIGGAGYAVKDAEWAKNSQLVGRFTQYDLTGGTINARFMNWGMAWHGVKEHPILGWGQDNYEYVFSKYYNPNMYAQEPWFDRTHDLVFDWLIAAGFLGLITYFSMIVALLLHLWVVDPHEREWSWKSFTSFSGIKALIMRRDPAFSATERALWTGLIAAYVFHNLFVFDNIVSYILFFTVLAYLHWRVTEGHAPMWESADVAEETVSSVIFPVTAVALVVLVYFANVPGIKTSQALITALMPVQLPSGERVSPTPEDALAAYKSAISYDQLGRQEAREQLVQAASNAQRQTNVKNETRSAYYTLAVDEMKKELERNPDSARLWLFMGSLYMTSGQLADAEQALTTAVGLTPTKQVALFQLGEAKLYQGKNAEALDLFKKAYDLQPAYDEARTLYALVLIRNGKDKDAVDLLTERYGTAAFDDDRLLNEWTNAKRFDIVTQILESRAQKNPTDIQTKVSLAAAYKAAGQKDKAVVILQGIIKDNPQYKTQIEDFIKQVQGS